MRKTNEVDKADEAAADAGGLVATGSMPQRGHCGCHSGGPGRLGSGAC